MKPTTDTIAAISTAPGEAGVAIVRVSGPRALWIADRVFRCRGAAPSNRDSHTIVYGQVLAEDGAAIDDVILLIMRAPRSYTGEDVVEFQGHGGSLVPRRILFRLLQAGCRAADPGEFTRRAFLNGRIDLAQSEAILDLIRAKSDRAAKAAQEQAQGRTSIIVNQIFDLALACAAEIETALDFPEEDLASPHLDMAKNLLGTCVTMCTRLDSSAADGRFLRDGIRISIVGRPNVGKSTLFNFLCGTQRAITSSIPGTTRDTLEEWLSWNGYAIRLVDTAGIRSSSCSIEQEGVRRTMEEISRSDIVLYVIDSKENTTDYDDVFLREASPQKTILIINKQDLAPHADHGIYEKRLFTIRLSSAHDIDNNDVVNKIYSFICDSLCLESDCAGATMSARISGLIASAGALLCSAEKTINSAAGDKEVLACSMIRRSQELLGEITGRSYSDTLLDSIFSRFCIGK